jgi:type II secretory pathway pseudopilin PulG
MRTGSACRAARGFTYLWLLFVVAASSALAAASVQRWSTIVEREREAEQVFRAQQIAQALARYREASPGAKAWPLSLDVLTEDRRSGVTQRHLRRVYTDPATGLADWELVTDAAGGIVALRSRSTLRAWRVHDLTPQGDGNLLQRDRLFSAHAAAPAANRDSP